jgi:Flp pilus assembly protein TadG
MTSFAEAHEGNAMSARRFSRARHRGFAAHRAGTISLMFAIMVIPLLLIVGIAVDYSFYVEAQAELNLAADAAAMHAVRAMSMSTSNSTTYQNAGTLAGQQWFAAQAEMVPGVTLTGTGTPLPVTVNVSYTAPTYTATVAYTGTLNTYFGRLAGVRTWPIAGTATASISNNFVNIGVMLDASQSMYIGATPSDIATMQAASPCGIVKAENGITPGDDLYYPNYVWNYNNSGLGYLAGLTLPPHKTTTGYCDPNLLTGCAYPPSAIYGLTGTYLTTDSLYLGTANTKTGDLVGACNNGGGRPGAAGPHTPGAPCALACHENADGGDLYALARATTNQQTGNLVQLRFDVVQSAAQQVIQSMLKYSPTPQTLLGVGVYTFGDTFQPLYPCTTTVGCPSPFGTDLNAALSDISTCTGTQTIGCYAAPITKVAVSSTYMGSSFTQAAAFLTGTTGTGATQATAIKDLFIVTDGIEDINVAGIQYVGPLDHTVANPCQQIKNQGITIYVLYTPYYPIDAQSYADVVYPASPNGLYPAATLQAFVTEANPSNFPNYNAQYPADTPVAAALRACASNPAYFYMATSQADINTAMQNMLTTALNSAARVTN